jgi:glycosyltransferase involved in cell wall biosynthesis
MSSTPLRIAHINTEKTWRGGEQQMFNLVNCLSERGHTNICFARAAGALAERLKTARLAVYEFKPTFEWDVFSAYKLSRWLRRERVDVVHVHASHAMVQAALARRFYDIPTLATRRVDFHINKNPFSRWKYRRMDRVVAISDAVRKILVEDGIPSEKIVVVKSGVDAKQLAAVTPLTKTQMGFPSDCVLLGQIAALADHKDQPTLLGAVSLLKPKFPKLRVALVGDGALRSSLETLARQLNVADVVKFLGFKSNPHAYLAGFDYFCLSSKEEGLGTSVIDAMLLNVPVIGTRAGGIPELIENDVTGFLSAPRDAVALAAAIEKALLADGATKQRLVDAAHKKALGFTAEATAAQMESVYRSVLRSPSELV